MMTDKDVETKSSSSLTSKELIQNVLRDILSPMNRGVGGWCRGEPVTDRGKRTQVCTMIVIIMIPMVVLTGITVFYMKDTITDKVNVDEQWPDPFGGELGPIAAYSYCSAVATHLKVKDTIAISIQLGRILHALSLERDSSVLYLSALGPETTAAVKKTYLLTDVAIDDLKVWPTHYKKHPNYSSKDVFKLYINLNRAYLEDERTTIYTVLNFYTKIVNDFIGLLQRYISKSQDSGQWRSLVAYQKLVTVSNSAGIERALGANCIAKGRFRDNKTNLLFQEHMAIKETALNMVNHLQENSQQMFFLLHEETYNMIQMYEEKILTDTDLEPDLVAAEIWFNNMTVFIDFLNERDQVLGDKIIRRLRKSSSSRTFNVAIAVVLNGVTLLMCPPLIFTVIHIVNGLQKCVVTLATKTNELRKEKKKTDSLLYQMLPKTVAEKLKFKKEVESEFFNCVTVFFLDVQNFHHLVGRLAPMDIVLLLNELHNAYDSTVDCFDVYKVETIGDTYMCASGLPKRNDDRHVQEIADFSLNLMATTNAMPLANIRSVWPLKIRIGFNSGSVVAGVIGTSRPRYCIFGDTVNTASRMMSNGEGNSISVSEGSNRMLQSTGQYKTVSRGKVFLKGKGFMETFKLVGRYDGLIPKGSASLLGFPVPSMTRRDSTVTSLRSFSVSEGSPIRDGYQQTRTTMIRGTNNQDGRAMEMQELEQVFEECSTESPPIIQPVEGVHY